MGHTRSLTVNVDMNTLNDNDEGKLSSWKNLTTNEDQLLWRIRNQIMKLIGQLLPVIGHCF